MASTSTYRSQLLARTGISFQCLAPGIDETRLPGESGLSMVTRLACQKAAAIASQQPDAWIIGSDQAAILHDGSQGERLFGKPGGAVNCVEQLRACSGKTLSFVTGVTLMRKSDAAQMDFVDTTMVSFRTLDEETIERYVALDAPFDCAGGFKSESLGISLCESIDSKDPTALIGLPLIRLCALLRDAGFQLP